MQTNPTIETQQPTTEAVRFLIPVRYAAWLAGDLGKTLTERLKENAPDGATITRLPRGFLVENVTTADLDGIIATVRALEARVANDYPIFHHEMGPVWTGTVQVVCSEPEAGA